MGKAIKPAKYKFQVLSVGRKWVHVQVFGKYSNYKAKIPKLGLPEATKDRVYNLYGELRSEKFTYILEVLDEKVAIEDLTSRREAIILNRLRDGFSKNYVSKKCIEELKEIGCYEKNQNEIEENSHRIAAIRRRESIDRWLGYVRNAYSEGYIYERGVRELHKLNCFEYDDEFKEKRSAFEDAEK